MSGSYDNDTLKADLLPFDTDCRVKRTNCRDWKICVAKIAAGASVLCVLIFISGFFLGRYEKPTIACGGSSSSSASSSASSSSMAQALTLSYAGALSTIPAIQGNMPIEGFLSCLMVPNANVSALSVDCMPTNAILTHPGAVLFVLYQYLDATSLLITATGSQYGGLSGSSPVVEANFSLSFSGLIAEMYVPHALPGAYSTGPSGQFTSQQLVVRQTDTVNVVLNDVNLSPAFLASVYATGSTGDLALYVLDANLQPVLLSSVLPTSVSPMIFSYPLQGTPAPLPTSTPLAFTQLAQISDSNIGFFQSTPVASMRRSVDAASPAANKTVYAMELYDSNGHVLHRLEVTQSRTSGLGLYVNMTNVAAGLHYHMTLSGAQQIDLKQHGLLNATGVLVATTHSDTDKTPGAAILRRTHLQQSGMLSSVAGSPSRPAWASAALSQFSHQVVGKLTYATSAATSGRRGVSWSCVVDVLEALGDSINCASDVCEVVDSYGADLLDPFFDYDMVSGCWSACEDWRTVYDSC